MVGEAAVVGEPERLIALDASLRREALGERRHLALRLRERGRLPDHFEIRLSSSSISAQSWAFDPFRSPISPNADSSFRRIDPSTLTMLAPASPAVTVSVNLWSLRYTRRRLNETQRAPRLRPVPLCLDRQNLVGQETGERFAWGGGPQSIALLTSLTRPLSVRAPATARTRNACPPWRAFS